MTPERTPLEHSQKSQVNWEFDPGSLRLGLHDGVAGVPPAVTDALDKIQYSAQPATQQHPLMEAVFELLLLLDGIGPQTAADLLKPMPLPDFLATVKAGDISRLRRIPGIGIATAERVAEHLGSFEFLMQEIDDGRSAKLAQELRSTPKDFCEIADGFDGMLFECGVPAAEMLKLADLLQVRDLDTEANILDEARALASMVDQDYRAIAARRIASRDVIEILSLFCRASGKIPVRIAALCQVVQARLSGFQRTMGEWTQIVRDCKVRKGLNLPVIVRLLEACDKAQKTSLAAKGAAAYLSLIHAAGKSASEDGQLAVAVVVRTFTDMLEEFPRGAEIRQRAGGNNGLGAVAGMAELKQLLIEEVVEVFRNPTKFKPGNSAERKLIASINEAEERRREARVPGAPEVGIFWFYEGKLLLDGVPVNEAKCSDDFVNYRSSHLTLWGTYQRAGAVPSEVEYEEPPRGRVVYNAKIQQFTLFADACILTKKSVVGKIIRDLHLPPDTVTESDPHYRCFHCLGRSSR